MQRPPGGIEPDGDLARRVATLGLGQRHRRDQLVVHMARPILETLRQRLPGRQVDEIGGAGSNDLRQAHLPHARQPFRTAVDDRAMDAVVELLQAQVEHSRQLALLGEAFHCPPPHALGVEERGLVAARGQRRLEMAHVFQRRVAERGDADQRPPVGHTASGTGGAEHGARSLAERRTADRVETVEAARPEDHLDIGGKSIGRDQRREGDGGDDVFRHADRQRERDVERKIRAHGAAKRYHGVEAALGQQRQGQRARALAHQRHGMVLVAGRDDFGDRHAGGGGNVVLGDRNRFVGIAENTDIHGQHGATIALDDLAQEGELFLLGVEGPDDEDGLAAVGGHGVAALAECGTGCGHNWIHAVLSAVYFSSACSDLSCPLPDWRWPPSGTVRSEPP